MTSTTVVRAVVVAEDSAQRSRLIEALQRNADIAVIGHAVSARQAALLVAQALPDVVLLDLALKDCSGQQTVEQIMATAPRPILVLTGFDDDARALTAALQAGAVDSIVIPALWTTELSAALRRSVRQVSKVHVIRHPRGAAARPVRHPVATSTGCQSPVVAIAASTGGPSALAIVLAGLAGLKAPVLVVQHLHAEFTGGLLDWMSRASALPVSVAVHNEVASAGHVYLAPPKVHLRLAAAGRLELITTPVTLHQPSADELFDSIAVRAGAAGVGVILTGMGDDGAKGLLALKACGGRTLGQDEATCAVFGMPRAAHRLGAVSELLPLPLIAAAVHRVVAEVAAA